GGFAGFLALAGAFPVAGELLPGAVERPCAPVHPLRHGAAEPSPGPDQFVGRELPPGLVVLDDATRYQVAAERRGVEPMAAEAARHPDAALGLADLRHAMYRAAERAAPQMRDLHIAERGKIALDVGDQPACEAARLRRPGAHAPGPLQAIAADDAVVIVGAVGVADRAAIAHHLVQRVA